MGKTVKNPYLDTKHKGIKKHYKTGHYRARKKINGVDHKKTFANIRDAIQWRYTFNGINSVVGGHTIKKNSSKLAYVLSRFQDLHFPSLRPQTQKKMIQQYRLLHDLEHFEMHEINSTLLSEWIIQKVEHFKLLQAEGKGSGVQARCSLDTELKILKQVFSWYKEEAEFDNESKDVFCPVKKRHYALGSIKKKVKRDKKIPPSDVLLLFENLEPLYRDLAIIQYFCAGRIGETLGIQKDSIDFKNRILNISHTAIFNSSKTFWYLSDLTKTGEDRTVHINDTLRDALLSRINDGDKNCSFVIQYQGKPLNYGTALLHYNKTLKKLGLPYSGTHILRHGCASLARTLTGSLDACMSMTGHRDIRVAENYAELSDKVKIDTSLQVEEHLNKLKKAGPNSGFQLIQ